LDFRRIVREPLLHFLLLGLALFAWFGRVAPDDDGARRIVVTQAQVDLLATQFAATWNRPATAQELNGLVDSFIRDEILYREGKALGLDRDDAVVKRRVRQKLDVIFEESLAQNPPTDADLEAYLRAHPDAFRRPPMVTFQQLYFGSEAGSEARALAARTALGGGADAAGLGQGTLLPGRMDDTPLDLVARDFGEQFAQQLSQLPVGEWAGPVTSGFGVHLVRIEVLQPAQSPSLPEVREVVAREWENDRRQRAQEEAFARLRAEYAVDIQASLPGMPSS
jgi:PPIC-type PPIASE domain